ncbi:MULTISPECIES: P-loop NTPase fold protein [unclassified Actinopolyspora]|uniref:P-loop NTPase fold protein n=1 Tax=unclassified Actinopolyspora TaxID=2639451 RepID=UPI0013F59F27|nr:response regulator [Actinopolyspora sp. BKK2]NHE77209.1 response regulator [Actinopolyspora sp. BKK1]
MQSSGDDHFVVLNDEPVSNAEEDLLDTGNTADRLADLIVSSRHSTPFTLAIDAGWGMGKSSLMRQLQRRLDETAGIQTAWFNAWTSGTNALEVLIKSVLLRFDRNILRRAYHRVANTPRVSRFIRIVFLLTMTTLGLRRLVDALWSQISVDPKSRNEIHGIVKQMAQEWVMSSGSPGKQIVVFVDDLDRCQEDVVTAVCEAIKLYLDIPGLIFVIGYDRSALSRALQKADTANVRPSDYLEKIVQVNYHSPLPDQQQLHGLVRGYASRSGTSQLFDANISHFIAERTGRNPRRIKRLINSFVLEYHLDGEWNFLGANLLVRVLLLQHFYPAFYRLITSPVLEDPVQDFLDYRHARASIMLGELDSQNWKSIFTRYGIEPPSDTPSDRSTLLNALEQLEQALPEPMSRLSTEEAFTATLRQLKDSPHFDRLREHLQRRRFQPDLGEGETEQQFTNDGTNLYGAHVLVVDDLFAQENSEFSEPGTIVSILQEWGATVDTASDFESMERSARRRNPNLIISDINRHERENAGLEDLQILREKNIYTGPTIFYVARITGARRDWANELQAIGITNDFNEMLEWTKMSLENSLTYR